MDAASSLPEDVLGLIFQHISNDERFHSRYLDDVLLVCRRWHAVALGHSRLWARIIIDIEAENTLGVYDFRVRYISQRLSLSRTAPLAIEISLDGFFDAHCSDATCKCQDSHFDYGYYEPGCDNTVKYLNQARRLIRLAVGPAGEHMARWGSLSIDFSTRYFDFEEDELGNMGLLEDLAHPTPLLRVLSLNGIEGSFRTLLPSLPSLIRYEFASNGRISDLSVPWSSLRSLEFSDYSEYTDRGVFLCVPECTRLEGLYITNPARWRPETLEALKNTNPFKCTLPSLSSFELLCPIPLDMTNFNLPSLIDLTLAIPDSFKDPQETAWDAKMQRVGYISTLAANTRRLKLLHKFPRTRDHTESQAPQAKLVEMLECMPKLEEIYVPSTLYLRIRTILRGDLGIVPHLEKIFVIPEKDHPILVNGKDFGPRGGSVNWRTGTPLLFPGTFPGIDQVADAKNAVPHL